MTFKACININIQCVLFYGLRIDIAPQDVEFSKHQQVLQFMIYNGTQFRFV